MCRIFDESVSVFNRQSGFAKSDINANNASDTDNQIALLENVLRESRAEKEFFYEQAAGAKAKLEIAEAIIKQKEELNKDLEKMSQEKLKLEQMLEQERKKFKMEFEKKDGEQKQKVIAERSHGYASHTAYAAGEPTSLNGCQEDSNTPCQQQLYKTTMCKFFLQNKCTKGFSCSYAHVAKELRRSPDLTKTSICKQYRTFGVCEDSNCRYAHSKKELRVTGKWYKSKMCAFHKLGQCRAGASCHFAHSAEQLEINHTLDPLDQNEFVDVDFDLSSQKSDDTDWEWETTSTKSTQGSQSLIPSWAVDKVARHSAQLQSQAPQSQQRQAQLPTKYTEMPADARLLEQQSQPQPHYGSHSMIDAVQHVAHYPGPNDSDGTKNAAQVVNAVSMSMVSNPNGFAPQLFSNICSQPMGQLMLFQPLDQSANGTVGHTLPIEMNGYVSVSQPQLYSWMQ